jgi:hypothetical protein
VIPGHAGWRRRSKGIEGHLPLMLTRIHAAAATLPHE